MVIYQHESAVKHAVPTGHPERPERITHLTKMLDKEFSDIARKQAPIAQRQTLSLIHDETYLSTLFALAPENGLQAIDGDTYLSPHSLEAALRGVGGACAAVDDVMTGVADSAFVAMRPAGHHAEPQRAMGFCFFSNAAIAAVHARKAYGIENVAVLDFDVHHGNGTQASFVGQPHCYYASTHEMPLFPGTGQVSEDETILNQPLRSGMDGTDVLAAWAPLLADLERSAPELIIISAGFDAHRDDPLASIEMQSSDFYEVTSRITALAQKTPSGRVVSLLEGGYDLDALADSAHYHIIALLGKEI